MMNQLTAVDLSRAQIDLLQARTEGWAAGLQLAGLSLRSRPDVDRADFVDTFSGSHRFIFDYLVDEVVDRQPELVRTFLHHTAILDRLCDGLCDAVTLGTTSAAMLEELERANLFLVALDDDRRWYRYHSLFGEALRHRLVRQTPELVPELHRRAMGWYSAHGFGPEAVEHALAASDWTAASEFIDALVGELHGRGQYETVRRWLTSIPADARRRIPLLMVNFGLSLLGVAAYDRVGSASAAAASAAQAMGDRVALGRALLLDANMALLHGQSARGIELAQQVRSVLPLEDARGHAAATVLLAMGRLASGDVAGTERELACFAESNDQPTLSRRVRSDLGQIEQLRGRLKDATAHYRALLDELGDLPLYEGIEVRVRLAAVYGEWDQLHEAEALLQQALEFAQRLHTLAFQARIHLGRARVLRSRRILDRAEAALDEALPAAEQMRNVLQVRWIHAERAHLHLLRGELAKADRWADDVGGAPDLHTFEREVEALAFARVKLAGGRPEPAVQVLDRMLDRAQEAGQEASAIAILALRSIGQHAQADHPAAVASLTAALQRALPGGFRRVFLDEGPALVPILRRISGYTQQCSELIKALEQPAGLGLLSARECDVLRLVDGGLTNREIAAQLVVTPNTIKTHLRNIGVKLEAGSRTQLLARARAEGMLR